jgi:hypothetical protein
MSNFNFSAFDVEIISQSSNQCEREERHLQIPQDVQAPTLGEMMPQPLGSSSSLTSFYQAQSSPLNDTSYVGYHGEIVQQQTFELQRSFYIGSSSAVPQQQFSAPIYLPVESADSGTCAGHNVSDFKMSAPDIENISQSSVQCEREERHQQIPQDVQAPTLGEMMPPLYGISSTSTSFYQGAASETVQLESRDFCTNFNFDLFDFKVFDVTFQAPVAESLPPPKSYYSSNFVVSLLNAHEDIQQQQQLSISGDDQIGSDYSIANFDPDVFNVTFYAVANVVIPQSSSCHATDAYFSSLNYDSSLHSGEAAQELRQAGSSFVTAACRRTDFDDDDLPGRMSDFHDDSTISLDRGDDGDKSHTGEHSPLLPLPSPGHYLGDHYPALRTKYQMSALHAYDPQQNSQQICPSYSVDNACPSDAGNVLFLTLAADALSGDTSLDQIDKDGFVPASNRVELYPFSGAESIRGYRAGHDHCHTNFNAAARTRREASPWQDSCPLPRSFHLMCFEKDDNGDDDVSTSSTGSNLCRSVDTFAESNSCRHSADSCSNDGVTSLPLLACYERGDDTTSSSSEMAGLCDSRFPAMQISFYDQGSSLHKQYFADGLDLFADYVLQDYYYHSGGSDHIADFDPQRPLNSIVNAPQRVPLQGGAIRRQSLCSPKYLHGFQMSGQQFYPKQLQQ